MEKISKICIHVCMCLHELVVLNLYPSRAIEGVCQSDKLRICFKGNKAASRTLLRDGVELIWAFLILSI